MFGDGSRAVKKRWRGGVCLWLSLAGAAAAQTPAGTQIVNVAHVVFVSDGTAREVASNAVTLIVAERLDVGLTHDGGAVTEIAAAPVAVPLMLTNHGSGAEAFGLTADSSTSTVIIGAVAIDRDGDGRFDPAVDTLLGSTTPSLAPGETMKLVATIGPAGAAPVTDGVMTLTARATTGSGAAGTPFPGAGEGGGDAVVGSTGAIDAIAARFTGAGAGAGAASAPTLVKTQDVRAPDGSATPVSGAVVTYTLTGHFPGAARAARIDDPLPAGTVYLPGTLTLDGQALTDAADADAGQVVADRVAVTLGDVPPNATHQVRFQIRLP